jgi:predicted metal-dependent hydrolase
MSADLQGHRDAEGAVPAARRSSPVLLPPGLLAAYPESVRAEAQALLDSGRLGPQLRRRYPDAHEVRTDAALYEYVLILKNRHLRSAPPLSKVVFDNRLQRVHSALGTHTTVSRVQGGRLKSKREIRVAGLFRRGPPEFLRMIVVHELAHLKEREHDRAFYALCTHMEPAYHQLEFDLRLALVCLDITGLWPWAEGTLDAAV